MNKNLIDEKIVSTKNRKRKRNDINIHDIIDAVQFNQRF